MTEHDARQRCCHLCQWEFKGDDFALEETGEKKYFCCEGCLQVYKILRDSKEYQAKKEKDGRVPR